MFCCIYVQTKKFSEGENFLRYSVVVIVSVGAASG